MAQKMALQISIKQQLRMTQQLQQAIKLLQLSRLELIDTIQQELTENPTLEEVQESEGQFLHMQDGEPPAMPNDNADLQASLRNLDNNIAKTDNIDWDAYINQYQTHTPLPESSGKGFIGEELPSYEATLSAPPNLVEHLLRQVKLTRFDETQERIALEIIGNINEDGYLVAITLEEIAQNLDVDLDSVVYVQETIQEFDPIGVGSRDLRECLLAQAEILYPDNTLVRAIIETHIPHLERKNYEAIARAQKTTVDRVVRAARLIASLNPKPGIKYTDERPLYITPDVYVERNADGEYHVVINDDGLPKLRICSYYNDLIRCGTVSDAATYVREKMSNARWFLRSIQQRERTIYRVTEAIVQRQREFFEKGIHFLKPMVLKDIGDDTGLSESTISRVTTKKYVHTPQGTFELKFFFTSRISRMDSFGGEDLASAAVRERIRAIIAAEDPKRPLSDQKIGEILKEENIDIARRTVAKYREVLGILPSAQRKSI
ncbi:MAG: RNA polymerase factor sigma-54 [Proteobacteria bacterium]|nr:RNA polymerase factor sigma-54 [Pseudomonadota bacterium]